jgi:hypothetical protein
MSEVHNPILGYADSYRLMVRMAEKEGKPLVVSMWSVITDLERNMAPLMDAAQSELSALREELADMSNSLELSKAELTWQEQDNVDLRKSLTAAEQRNAELTKAIADAEYRADQGKVWNGMGWTYTGLHSHGQQKVLDILRAALKPTESGASEAERKEDEEALQRRFDQERAEYLNESVASE